MGITSMIAACSACCLTFRHHRRDVDRKIFGKPKSPPQPGCEPSQTRMNRNKWILTLVTVLLIGSTAVVLARYKSIQRLGETRSQNTAHPRQPQSEVVLPEKC